jgi:putative transcriptional regulator
MKKRNLFNELLDGVDDMGKQREGKLTLRQHVVTTAPAPTVAASEIIHLRESLKLSQAVFANYLRVNVRTLQNWEQDRAKPNAQAAVLIRLVESDPQTLKKLASL